MSKEAMKQWLKTIEYHYELNPMRPSEIAKVIREIKAELAKQEQGEPVAWYIREKDMLTRDANWVAEYPDMCEPLYTTPQQQRKPLTDEQRRAIILKADTVGQAIAMVEAAHGIKE